MQKIVGIFIFCFSLFGIHDAFAQDLKTSVRNNKELDSTRKKEEDKKDSVVFTAKYIRYTTLKLTKDSVQTLPIDTGLVGIQNFSVLVQPRNPTIGTGVLGLAAKQLLFEPTKNIGFDAGFHALDMYALGHDDIKFYRARSQFTNLYYVNAGDKEQVLKLTHSQNINKNLNFGANFNRIGANGAYTHQRGDDLNGAFFSWFQSPNKRYTLYGDVIFNTLKAEENGSIRKENIFAPDQAQLAGKQAEPVKLTTARQLYRKTSLMLRQSYFVGRIDSTGVNSAQSILPTNKITHTFTYTKSSFNFKKDEEDSFNVLPSANPSLNYTPVDSVFTNDSTNVNHVQNQFVYSFFLRAKGTSIIKNELKIDAGIKHDFYSYNQNGLLRDTSYYYRYKSTFQNLTLLGSLGYRFSNRVDFNLDLQQIFQGRNIGDFLYEAKSNFSISEKTGRIVLNAYQQNKSPQEIYNRYYGNYYNWSLGSNLDKTKITNLTFTYINDLLKLDASASYYLVSNYLYFGADPNIPNGIMPMQESSAINLLKISVGKRFNYRSWHLDGYVVYQKTDSKDLLRTPEVYTFNSLYKDQTFFKKLKTQIGIDFRYNTTYKAYSYAIPVGQFYNGDPVTFSSKPIVDAWVKAGLRRANLFLKYEYANQGLLSNGYYQVNRYPQQDRILKFGVSWNFYD